MLDKGHRKGMDMKNRIWKKLVVISVSIFIFTFALAGCGQSDRNVSGDSGSPVNENANSNEPANSAVESNAAEAQSAVTGGLESDSSDSSTLAEGSDDTGNASESVVSATELEVCFGDDGEPFILHLYDNETAAAIARHVGTADWRLPIYHYDDYDNWEVMQYYDIPSRYEIPSGAETITSEKAGEVYYSEPNRIVLFYGDAEVTGEYTRVGYFDDTEEFREAVENNPALEGWNTKMVLIGSVEQWQ